MPAPRPVDPDPRVHVHVHTDMAKAAASRMRVRGVLWEDKVQTAWVGILEARETWDPAKGSWAGWASRHARFALLALARSTFRMGRCGSLDDQDAAVYRLYPLAIEAQLRGESLDLDVARMRLVGVAHSDRLQGESSDLRALVAYVSSDDVSLDSPADPRQPEGPSVADTLAVEDAGEEVDARQRLALWYAVMDELEASALTPLERAVFLRRMWVDVDEAPAETLDEVAAPFNLSRERARQVQYRLRILIARSAAVRGLLPRNWRPGDNRTL